MHRRNEKRGCGRDTWEDPGGKGEENAGPQSKWIIPLVAIRGDPFGNAQSSQGYCCHCLSCQDCFHNLFSPSCISHVLSNLENWIFTLTILNYQARWSSLPDSRWEKLYSRNRGPLELPAPRPTGTLSQRHSVLSLPSLPDLLLAQWILSNLLLRDGWKSSTYFSTWNSFFRDWVLIKYIGVGGMVGTRPYNSPKIWGEMMVHIRTGRKGVYIYC